MENLIEGQIVQCTVDKIIGTVVFVKIDNNGEGTITTSEISPGRIRNLRDYVVPGKKIVCKILSISEKNIYLSLRRVKTNEKKEFLEKLAKANSIKAILKTVTPQYEKIMEKIQEEYDLVDFFNDAKTNPKILNSFFNKGEAEQILKILESKKEKLKAIKQAFKLSNKSSNGITIIKDILSNSCKDNNCSISYIAAGKYNMTIHGTNLKQLQSEIDSIIKKIEIQAKTNKCNFELIKAK